MMEGVCERLNNYCLRKCVFNLKFASQFAAQLKDTERAEWGLKRERCKYKFAFGTFNKAIEIKELSENMCIC